MLESPVDRQPAVYNGRYSSRPSTSSQDGLGQHRHRHPVLRDYHVDQLSVLHKDASRRGHRIEYQPQSPAPRLLIVRLLFQHPIGERNDPGPLAGIIAGEIGLAVLIAVLSGAMPATMAELAPWRVRCTVLSVAYNLGMAALTFIGSLLLPATARHSLTKEFDATRFR